MCIIVIGKEMVCHPEVPPADLKSLCRTLRICCNQTPILRPTKKKRLSSPDTADVLPDSAFDLLYKCLDVNPKTRLTASLALEHPFLEGIS